MVVFGLQSDQHPDSPIVVFVRESFDSTENMTCRWWEYLARYPGAFRLSRNTHWHERVHYAGEGLRGCPAAKIAFGES